MLVKTFGAAISGIHAQLISIEVSASKGAKFFMVGLPDKAIQESTIRVTTAIKSLGIKGEVKKIVINLAPADLKKEGSGYDLPIAIGILGATNAVSMEKFNDFILMGELGLDGVLQPIKGALSIALLAKRQGFKGVIVPKENVLEAAIVEGIDVYGVESLVDVIAFFNAQVDLQPVCLNPNSLLEHSEVTEDDFSEVKGQENIKRALEIAAAGSHNLILIGPPGAGKTMLAKRLPGLLPDLTIEEAIETTQVHSVSSKGMDREGLITKRPFRAPHYSISDAGLIGGGALPEPGEISLAHNGVLFLDEMPEFKRSVLEVLRGPVEEGKLQISRAKFSVEYPSKVMLVASMNPCGCGYYNHPKKECTCSAGAVDRYLNKISGPMLDRIDLHVEVVPVTHNELMEEKKGETSAQIRERVLAARKIQEDRFKGRMGVYGNAHMSGKDLEMFVVLDESTKTILQKAMEKLDLSGRAYNRILKVARTIADLDGSERVEVKHVAEAIQYRSLDRGKWGK